MDLYFVLAVIVSIVFGIYLGVVITSSRFNSKNDGELIIDTTDPEYATAGFIFNIGVDEAIKRKQLVIKVKTQK